MGKLKAGSCQKDFLVLGGGITLLFLSPFTSGTIKQVICPAGKTIYCLLARNNVLLNLSGPEERMAYLLSSNLEIEYVKLIFPLQFHNHTHLKQGMGIANEHVGRTDTSYYNREPSLNVVNRFCDLKQNDV